MVNPSPEPDEVYGYDAERRRLAAQWQENEREIARLADLPTGTTDPTARERELDERQDELEGDLGEIYLRERQEGSSRQEGSPQ